MAKPVPWTVSFDAEPPQVALAAAAAGGEDKPTATSTPAVISATTIAAAFAGFPIPLLVSPMLEQTSDRRRKFPTLSENRRSSRPRDAEVPLLSEERPHLLAEGGHLIAHLRHRPGRETELEMGAAESGELGQVLGDLLR
jgi:hypothetical protein